MADLDLREARLNAARALPRRPAADWGLLLRRQVHNVLEQLTPPPETLSNTSAPCARRNVAAPVSKAGGHKMDSGWGTQNRPVLHRNPSVELRPGPVHAGASDEAF